MERRIYVDLGANQGETVARFQLEHRDFLIYAFEPMPQLAKYLRRRFATCSQVSIVERAAWISEELITFYPGRESNQSSTILIGKKPYPGWTVDYERPLQVIAIDFDRWLREITSINDHIIVKMDIEGAEYRLLSRLIKTGLLPRINTLAVEWHADRFPDEVTIEEHHRIRDAVCSLTTLIDWV